MSPAAILLVSLLSAEAAPLPAMTVEEVAATEKPFGGAHYVTFTWYLDVKSDPGKAVLMFDAVCRVGEKDVKSSKGLNVVKGVQAMKQGIISHAAPTHCQVQLSEAVIGKLDDKKPLSTFCWEKGSLKPTPGACKPVPATPPAKK